MTKNKDFMGARIKGHVWEATPTVGGGCWRVWCVCAWRHENDLSGLGWVNVNDKILQDKITERVEITQLGNSEQSWMILLADV